MENTMSRYEYLCLLEKKLASLPKEEQKEAMQYYHDYFEEADNDEQVIKELGSPDQLAQTILSSIPSVPAMIDGADSHENNSTTGSFAKLAGKTIKELYINCKLSAISIIPDEDFYVDYINCPVGSIKTSFYNGVFSISTTKSESITSSIISFFKQAVADQSIRIHMPVNSYLDKLSFNVGAGQIHSEINLKAKESVVKVAAGEIRLENLDTDNIDLRCGMGEVRINGEIKGGKLECGMGEVRLKVKGNPELYSINGSVGMGELRYNGLAREFTGNLTTERKANHFDASVGMGEMRIDFIK